MKESKNDLLYEEPNYEDPNYDEYDEDDEREQELILSMYHDVLKGLNFFSKEEFQKVLDGTPILLDINYTYWLYSKGDRHFLDDLYETLIEDTNRCWNLPILLQRFEKDGKEIYGEDFNINTLEFVEKLLSYEPPDEDGRERHTKLMLELFDAFDNLSSDDLIKTIVNRIDYWDLGCLLEWGPDWDHPLLTEEGIFLRAMDKIIQYNLGLVIGFIDFREDEDSITEYYLEDLFSLLENTKPNLRQYLNGNSIFTYLCEILKFHDERYSLWGSERVDIYNMLKEIYYYDPTCLEVATKEEIYNLINFVINNTDSIVDEEYHKLNLIHKLLSWLFKYYYAKEILCNTQKEDYNVNRVN